MEVKNKKVVGWSFIILAVIAIGMIIGAMFYILSTVNQFDQVFMHGVTIEDIPIGGLTKDEAFLQVQAKVKDDLQKHSIELVDSKKEKRLNLSFQTLGIVYPIEEVVDKAFLIGHEENFWKRYRNAKTSLEQAVNFEVTYRYDMDMIRDIISNQASIFYKAPQDATIERKNKKFVITPEILGEELDVAKTCTGVEELLKTEKTTGSIEVSLSPIVPTHTANSLQEIQSPISSFYTSYNNADYDRNVNLEVAARKINEVLAPGEVFSLAKHLEPITAAEGYRESKVIVNGRIEEGIGGGVCQIASTLYNAVLLSNLEVTVRKNHSLPVAYVPLGRDATYASGGIDFRFKNNSEYPVFIESYCENNRVYVNIFSHGSLKPSYDDIKFQSEIIEVIPAPPTQYIEDPELLKNTQIQELPPLEGKKVKLYKLYYKNNELIKKEVVDVSYYKPRAEVVKVGTKLLSTSSPNIILPKDNLASGVSEEIVEVPSN